MMFFKLKNIIFELISSRDCVNQLNVLCGKLKWTSDGSIE